jgi:hypothetical protein
MKWSWKLGKFAGIDVYLHATFILLQTALDQADLRKQPRAA